MLPPPCSHLSISLPLLTSLRPPWTFLQTQSHGLFQISSGWPIRPQHCPWSDISFSSYPVSTSQAALSGILSFSCCFPLRRKAPSPLKPSFNHSQTTPILPPCHRAKEAQVPQSLCTGHVLEAPTPALADFPWTLSSSPPLLPNGEPHTGTHPRVRGVLLLAGIEFVFFIVASTGLWFGFVLGTVLITQGCFSYC